MAGTIQILTPEQKQFLAFVAKERTFCKRLYFTGGTPLAAFYLHHRLSEDIDLFSETEFSERSLAPFMTKVQRALGITNVVYDIFLGLHTFQLTFPNETILKVDFSYYPYPRIEKGTQYLNISVDSLLDVAVNKIHTIATSKKSRARDFIDIFFILKKEPYVIGDLIMKAKAKFDWHIDRIHIGNRLADAANATDFPRMLKPIDHSEWKNFFVAEAAKLKDEIFM